MSSRKGNIFTVVAPSGAGKTTIVSGLLAADPQIQLSVSYTTRAPREGETEGKSYHFVSVDTFQHMIARQELLEYAQVHGNWYGTSRLWLEEAQRNGRDILLEIDWQGAQQVRHIFAETIGIFILPPSLSTLEKRLLERGTDKPEVIERRLKAARTEIEHIHEFDYVIINEYIEKAVSDLTAIVRAARLTCIQQQFVINTILNPS
jgi:guanylate kinase